jgi:hypothetical protein
MLGFFMLSIYIENSTIRSFLVSAILLSLATLTRYAGIAFIGTSIFSILIFHKKSISRRILWASLFGVISFLPFIFWTIRNSWQTGTATSRMIAFHPVNSVQLLQLFNTVSGWFLLPQGTSGIIKFIFLCIILVCLLAIVLSITKNKNQTVKIPIFILIISSFIFIYPTFLLISISIFDANTPLDDRILSPLFVSLIIVILYLINNLYDLHRENKIVINVLIITSIVVFIFNFYNGISWLIHTNGNGLGFSSKDWHDSELISQIQGLPPDSVLYSNAPHAVYILTGKSVRALPNERFDTTQNVNQNYLIEMKDVLTQIQNHSSFVIYFSVIGRDSELEEDNIIKLLSLNLQTKYPEGSIYQSNPEN